MTTSRTRQTTETVRSDFDRIASLAEEGWNHNAHYHRFLLRQIPEGCRDALEIGCGAGGFSRLLARRAGRIVAVDLSPLMIRAARGRSKLSPNVEFVNADVMSYPLPEEHFDCIATLTTLHHLPAEAALRKVRKALKPGGVFVCLDLYRRDDLPGLLLDCAAYPAAVLLRLLKTGRPRPPRPVREAYAEHGKTDTYLTLREVGRVCAEVMPGALVRRHLFWRYSVVWRK
ncbi:MAG TPA: class I SAM-dependent methyltransferase, partial [Pyrinomonadaceae bacterium]